MPTRQANGSWAPQAASGGGSGGLAVRKTDGATLTDSAWHDVDWSSGVAEDTVQGFHEGGGVYVCDTPGIYLIHWYARIGADSLHHGYASQNSSPQALLAEGWLPSSAVAGGGYALTLEHTERLVLDTDDELDLSIKVQGLDAAVTDASLQQVGMWAQYVGAAPA